MDIYLYNGPLMQNVWLFYSSVPYLIIYLHHSKMLFKSSSPRSKYRLSIKQHVMDHRFELLFTLNMTEKCELKLQNFYCKQLYAN